MQNWIAPMIETLIAKHVPGLEWSFNKRLTKTPGRCHVQKTPIGYYPIKIDFSYKFFSDHGHNIKLLTGIVLHEIAHALTPGDRHGSTWERKCREIGGIAHRKIPSHMVTPPVIRVSKEASIEELIAKFESAPLVSHWEVSNHER